MFGRVTRTSKLTDERLHSLYGAPDVGGEKTMRARVIRELIDEIRAQRQGYQHDDDHGGSTERVYDV